MREYPKEVKQEFTDSLKIQILSHKRTGFARFRELQTDSKEVTAISSSISSQCIPSPLPINRHFFLRFSGVAQAGKPFRRDIYFTAIEEPNMHHVDIKPNLSSHSLAGFSDRSTHSNYFILVTVGKEIFYPIRINNKIETFEIGILGCPGSGRTVSHYFSKTRAFFLALSDTCSISVTDICLPDLRNTRTTSFTGL